jgi:hypothetical protein
MARGGAMFDLGFLLYEEVCCRFLVSHVRLQELGIFNKKSFLSDGAQNKLGGFCPNISTKLSSVAEGHSVDLDAFHLNALDTTKRVGRRASVC